MNKKADITYLAVIIIVSLISLGVIVSFFTNTSENISTNKDDIICSSFMKLKGDRIYSIVDFFSQLNTKCKVDELTIKENSRNEIYSNFADMSSSCYNRYGSGEYDFLEKYQANGNWCFLCAKVKFEDKNLGRIGEYLDFIDWTKNNKKIGEDNFYYDSTKYLYVNETSKEELLSLQLEIDEVVNDITKEGFSELNDIALLTINQYQTLIDYTNKEVDSSQEYFITYKFDRIDKEYEQQLEEAMNDARNAMIGGVVASIGTEIALSAGAGATVGLVCGPGAPFCSSIGAVAGGVVGVVKGISKTISASTRTFMKLGKLSQSMKKLMSFSSNKVITSSDNFLEITSSSGKVLKLSKKIQNMKATPDEIIDFSSLMKKDGFTGIGNHFEELAKGMKSKDIKDLDNLVNDPKLIKTLEDLTDVDLTKIPNSPSAKYLSDLKELREIAIRDIADLKVNKVPNSPGIRYYLTFLLGGFIGYNFEDTPNTSRQYVDIMTKEEFYRQCGFPPGTTPTN